MLIAETSTDPPASSVTNRGRWALYGLYEYSGDADRDAQRGEILNTTDSSPSLERHWPDQQGQALVGVAQELLTLLFGEERAAELLDLIGVSVVTYALDANVIIQDLSRFIRTGEPTG
jgi:hypothetical protein